VQFHPGALEPFGKVIEVLIKGRLGFLDNGGSRHRRPPRIRSGRGVRVENIIMMQDENLWA